MSEQGDMSKQGEPIILQDYSPIDDKLKNHKALLDCLRDVRKPANKIYVLPNWEEQSEASKGRLAVIDDVWIDAHKRCECRTQKYIGILQCKDVTIFIGSRFDNKIHNYFTSYIISKALNIKGLLLQDMQPEITKPEHMVEQLIAIIFVNQIRVAWKQGLFRMYQKFECNDAKVRGKIDVTRHINLNPLFNGRIAYSYREYTADNDVNRIIFTAFSMLEKNYRSFMKGLLNMEGNRSVKDCMRQLGSTVQPVPRQELQKLLKRKNQKIHHSVYKDWEAVRETAIMILRNMGVDIAHEDKYAINGILIDMTEMWERYLESILREKGQESGMQFKAQDSFGVLYGKNYNFRRKFIPDFCWKRENKTVFIADAKYRESWEKIAEKEQERKQEQEEGAGTGKLEWKWSNDVREDVFQVLSYMYARDCKHGAIICPVKVDSRIESESVNDTDKFLYHTEYYVRGKGSNDDIFHLFALAIPQKCTDYADFKVKMKSSEENLRKVFNAYIG